MKSVLLSRAFAAISGDSSASNGLCFWSPCLVVGFLFGFVAVAGAASVLGGEPSDAGIESILRENRKEESRNQAVGQAVSRVHFDEDGGGTDRFDVPAGALGLNFETASAFASVWGSDLGDEGNAPPRQSAISDGEGSTATNLWGMERRVPWGESLDSLRPRFPTRYTLTEAFPLLRFRNLSDVGAFPAFGLLWGIENDIEGAYGSIWQWQDRLQSNQKALFQEFDRHVVGLAFPCDFETTGHMYVATAGKRLRDGSRVLEVLQFRVHKTPPFRLMTDRSMVVARGESRKLPDGILHAASDGSILVDLGEGASLMAASSTVRVRELPRGVWKIVPIFDSLTGELRGRIGTAPQGADSGSEGEASTKPSIESIWGIVSIQPRLLLRDFSGTVGDRSLQGPWNRDLSIGGSVLPQGSLGTKSKSIVVADTSTGDIWGVPIEVSQGAPVLIAKTSRKLRRIGKDSNQEPLWIDADGRVLRLIDHADESTWEMPKRLSETGWYAHLANGEMDPKFTKFARGRAFAGHGDAQDYWVCVPRGETIDATKQGRWRFPDGTLLVQTLYKNVAGGKSPTALRRMETRVLLRLGLEWYPYSYLWNSDQTDALLVVEDQALGGLSKSDSAEWAVPSRTQCNLCHIQAGRGYRLSFRHEGFAPKSPLEPVHSTVTLQELTELGVLGAGPVRLARPRGGIRENKGAILVSDADRMLKQKPKLAGFDASWFKPSLLKDHLNYWSKALNSESGAFQSNLDSNWAPLPQPHVTIGSQGNTLYLMCVGTTVSNEAVYQEAVTRGADFLVEHFVDAQFGGFFESVGVDGEKIDGGKNLEGQAIAMLGLAYASQATGRNDYLEVAVKVWSQIKSKMNDPKRGWCTQASEDFSQRQQCSQRALMRVFEALVTLIDITGSESLAEDAEDLADFVLGRLWREPGYLADEFDVNWSTPIPMRDGKTIDIGNQAKWAFLLSESVRVGLPRRFLTWGQRLFDYVSIYGLDDSTGTVGEPGNLSRRTSWQQAEYLRMLIRYADQHGRESEWTRAAKVQQYIKVNCIDSFHGGWKEAGMSDKGSLTRTGEHEVGMYVEGIRFEKELPQKNAISEKK